MAISQKMVPIKKTKKNFKPNIITNAIRPMKLHITSITLKAAYFKKLKPNYVAHFKKKQRYIKDTLNTRNPYCRNIHVNTALLGGFQAYKFFLYYPVAKYRVNKLLSNFNYMLIRSPFISKKYKYFLKLKHIRSDLVKKKWKHPQFIIFDRKGAINNYKKVIHSLFAEKKFDTRKNFNGTS